MERTKPLLFVGESAPKVQTSAAMLVLGKLGEVSLAIDLVAELWPKKLITSSAAVRVINYALKDDSPTLQRAAAVILLNNVDQLDVAKHQWEWPDSLEKTWPMWLDSEARSTIAFALTDWLVIRKPQDINDFRVDLIKAAKKSETNLATQRVLTRPDVLELMSSITKQQP